MIGYDDFREILLKTENYSQTAKRKIHKTKDNKFLASIQTVSELNQLLNPSNKDLERSDHNNEDFGAMLRDKHLDMEDEELENTLLYNEDSQTIENFDKYLDIMLDRHLKFNQIEEDEFKKRNIDDLDLNNITEHFVLKKTILNKVFQTYINYKSKINSHESEFIRRMYQDMLRILEFYIGFSVKLRKTKENEFEKNQNLIAQNNDFLDAMTAVKQMKSTEKLDYYLFGIKRLTEQKYFSIMHAAKQSLKVANHELAYRQVKFLDDFYEFLLSQQKKIQHSSEKIENMETEIASLRRTVKENKVKSNEELKNMLKFSEEQKAKIGKFHLII